MTQLQLRPWPLRPRPLREDAGRARRHCRSPVRASRRRGRARPLPEGWLHRRRRDRRPWRAAPLVMLRDPLAGARTPSPRSTRRRPGRFRRNHAARSNDAHRQGVDRRSASLPRRHRRRWRHDDPRQGLHRRGRRRVPAHRAAITMKPVQGGIAAIDDGGGGWWEGQGAASDTPTLVILSRDRDSRAWRSDESPAPRTPRRRR